MLLENKFEILNGINFIEKNNCPICENNSRNIDTVYTINPESELKVTLKECLYCKHWWVSPMPRQELLNKLYSVGSLYVVNKGYSGTVVENSKELFHQISKEVSFLGVNSQTKYLEVGIGNGILFNAIEKIADVAVGIEPGQWSYKSKNVFSDICEVSNKNKFNLINIQDVLEHLEDPISMMKIVFGLSEEKAIISCGFPRSDSLEARVRKGKWRMLRPLGHLHFFSYKSLSIMLEESQWSLIKAIKCRPGNRSLKDVLFNNNRIYNPFFEINNVLSEPKDQWRIVAKKI